MTLDYFRSHMSSEGDSWYITGDVTLYYTHGHYELVDYSDDTTKTFQTVEELLNTEVYGKNIKYIIENTEDFPSTVMFC